MENKRVLIQMRIVCSFIYLHITLLSVYTPHSYALFLSSCLLSTQFLSNLPNYRSPLHAPRFDGPARLWARLVMDGDRRKWVAEVGLWSVRFPTARPVSTALLSLLLISSKTAFSFLILPSYLFLYLKKGMLSHITFKFSSNLDPKLEPMRKK